MYKDNLKNEAKTSLVWTIICLLGTVYVIFEYDIKEEVSGRVWFLIFVFFSINFLLLTISYIAYSILIDEEYINVKVFFVKKKIIIKDIESFKYKRIKKSKVFALYLYLESCKKIKIMVHNPEEALRILNLDIKKTND